MVRSVGSLVFGLSLCFLTGCTSLGSGRIAGLTDRGARLRSATAESSTSEAADHQISQERVSFRAPASSEKDPVDTDSADSWTPGHAAQQIAAVGKRQKTDAGNSITQARYEASNPRRLGSASDERPIQVDPVLDVSGDSSESKVVNALYETDRDGMENVVQIQGLQFDGPSELSGSRHSDGRSLVPGQTQSTAALRPNVDRMAFQSGHQAGARSTESAATPWQSELERLIAQAERELASVSRGSGVETQVEQRRLQIQLRLLYLIARHPEQALTAIPSLPPAEQEYWQQMIWAINDSLDVEDQLTPGERATQSIPRVNSALRWLRDQADLTIKNAAFCEEISYFGNYKRFPREEFVPGQPVLLYAEIENFRSAPSSSGEYRTSLRSILEIQDANGQIRWNKTFDATEDVCRNPRRDYFHNYQFSIPDSLRLGPHVMKLTVVDELSRKQSTCAIRFIVK